MSTVFEMIIAGDIPGWFAWADDKCAVFATIEPVQPGHMLVVPRVAYDKWTEVPAELFAHLGKVAQIVGRAQEVAFNAQRSTVVIAGFEVPHTHIHVIPAFSEADAQLSNAKKATDEELDHAVTLLRGALIATGHGQFVPPEMGSVNS